MRVISNEKIIRSQFKCSHSLIAIPVLFLMMMSSELSQTTTGIMADSQGDRQSFFDLYY